MDEFVQAETQIIKDDLKIVADAIDHDIIPKMKSLERMKMVPTLPDVSGATSAGREGHALLPQSKREAVKTRLETDRVGEQTSLGPQRLIEHDAAVKHKKRDQIDKAQSVQKSTEPAVHVVFSTDCSPFQDWQTLLVFHSARVVAQQGHITRIASGCSDKKQVELVTLYKKLWPNYYVHFTPDFKKDAKTKKKYDFYNKPYGVQHWLEHAEPPVSAGVIVALIDPDFVFLRPLTAKVKGNSNNLVSKPVEVGDIFDYVSKGHPVAQQYGLGAPWVYDSNPEFNRTKICGADSACRKVPDHKTGAKYWSVGPPYLLERDDLHRLTQAWTRFVPLVYEDYPQLLAEMYVMCSKSYLRVVHFKDLQVCILDGGSP